MKKTVDWGVLTYTMHPYVIGRGYRMLALEWLVDKLAKRGRGVHDHGAGGARRRSSGCSARRTRLDAAAIAGYAGFCGIERGAIRCGGVNSSCCAPVRRPALAGMSGSSAQVRHVVVRLAA